MNKRFLFSLRSTWYHRSTHLLIKSLCCFLKSQNSVFCVSYCWSFYSRWSRKAHLPSIPLKPINTNVTLYQAEKICWGEISRNFFFKNSYLLSCQSCLSHRSDKTNQTLKHGKSVLDGWMEKTLLNKWREVVMSGILTLSPMSPTFPVIPGSPCRHKSTITCEITMTNVFVLCFRKMERNDKSNGFYSP